MSPHHALVGPIKCGDPKAMAQCLCGLLATCQQFSDGYILVIITCLSHFNIGAEV